MSAEGTNTTTSAQARLEKATLGGGCFWCLEAVFERLPGVTNVVSGYTGGNVDKPTYRQVCNGTTGHAEVVQIEFNPAVISYEKILDVFWQCHDPTTLNRQGPDAGTQYRSAIFFHSPEQRAAAEQSKDRANVALFGGGIVTEIVPLRQFFVAEDYHQDYFRKHPEQPYCQVMIVPKLLKLEKQQKAAAAPSPKP
ncbi:MAG: peptide-methionine (S)-S-oxide reductase MsrA [Verrucomicrobiota bacterium]